MEGKSWYGNNSDFRLSRNIDTILQIDFFYIP